MLLLCVLLQQEPEVEVRGGVSIGPDQSDAKMQEVTHRNSQYRIRTFISSHHAVMCFDATGSAGYSQTTHPAPASSTRSSRTRNQEAFAGSEAGGFTRDADWVDGRRRAAVATAGEGS